MVSKMSSSDVDAPNFIRESTQATTSFAASF